MNISLTPELERALTEKAEQQGTTPELLALHDLKTLYIASPASTHKLDGIDGKILADFLANRTGRTDSRKQNGGKPSQLSIDENSFGEHLEEKREQGHL